MTTVARRGAGWAGWADEQRVLGRLQCAGPRLRDVHKGSDVGSLCHSPALAAAPHCYPQAWDPLDFQDQTPPDSQREERASRGQDPKALEAPLAAPTLMTSPSGHQPPTLSAHPWAVPSSRPSSPGLSSQRPQHPWRPPSASPPFPFTPLSTSLPAAPPTPHPGRDTPQRDWWGQVAAAAAREALLGCISQLEVAPRTGVVGSVGGRGGAEGRNRQALRLPEAPAAQPLTRPREGALLQAFSPISSQVLLEPSTAPRGR